MLNLLTDEDSIFRLLEPVVRAPSVHNIQPWWFRIVADDRIDLCGRFGGTSADENNGTGAAGRQVPESLRREQYISCGAALYNLRLAVRVAGHDLAVWLLPHGPRSSVLASIEIVIGRTKRATITEQELYDAIPERHTNRWPFNRRPVPSNLLAAMQVAAAQEQGRLRVLTRRQVRLWLREAQLADRALRGDHGYQPDPDLWAPGSDGRSGVPAAAFGPSGQDHRWPIRGLHPAYPAIRDFRPRVTPVDVATSDAAPTQAPDGQRHPHYERNPQLLVLCTRHDRPADWLRAGQALQRALLTGTCYGVSASFLTQPLELHDSTTLAASVGASAPRRLPWRWPFPEYPQLVMRVGFATRESVSTEREDPEVLDARTGRWLRAPSRTRSPVAPSDPRLLAR